MSNVQSYNALIDRFHAFASGHFILKRFSHGQIEVSDLEKFGEYPFMHVVPSNVSYSKGMKTFSFQIVLADLPRDKEDKPEYQREVLSDLQRIAEDLVAEITNHRMLFGDLITVQNVTLEPFLEEFHHTLTGWTISLDLLVPYYWDACSIPAEWNDMFERGSGGTGSILTFIDSIVRDENGNVSLVNDEETPAPNYYYGTNDEGVRGWYLTTDNVGITCETIGDCQTIIDIEAAIDALEEEILLKADITSISAVGFSNDYNDLDNKPTIPTATSDLTNDSGFITIGDVPAQVNADWNSVSGVSEILNKPTIPAAQIQSDWNQTNNVLLDFIKNKPTIPTSLPPNGAAGGDLSGTYPDPTVHRIHGIDMQNGTPTANDTWVYGGSPAKWQHQHLNASQVDNDSSVTGATVKLALEHLDSTKQATLVSGTNIKTVNSNSLLGAGNLSVGTVTSVAALTLGTTGTDLSSTVATGTTTPVITLNVPTASAANRGALSATDWTTFNSKISGLTVGTTAIASGAVNRILFQGTGNVLQESLKFTFDEVTNSNTRLLMKHGTAQASIIDFTATTGDYSGGFLSTGPTFAYGTYAANSANLTGGTGGVAIRVTSSSNFAIHGVNASVDNATKQFQLFGATGNVLIQNGGTFTDAGYKLDVNGTGRINTLTIGLGGGQVSTNMSFGVASMTATATGGNNIAIGFEAGQSITSGNSNVAIGFQALRFNNTGASNVVIGKSAGNAITGAAQNTAIGTEALISNTTSNNNTAIGSQSLMNVTGAANTAIGVWSGRHIADGSTANTTGSNSVFLGQQTRALANGQTNQIVIGFDTTGAGSNTATLGNTSIVDTILRGRVNIQQYATASRPTYVKGALIYDSSLGKLVIGGATGWEVVTSI